MLEKVEMAISLLKHKRFKQFNFHSLDGGMLIFFGMAICLFFISLVLPLINDTGNLNLSVLQAKAFLHGRSNIDSIVNDTALYNGKLFVPFPPFPSILLLPFLLVFNSVNTTLIALLLTFLNVYIFKSILQKLAVESTSIMWLMIAFFLGTAYWLLVRGSVGVWHFAQIVAITFTLLAINEVFGAGRGYLAGLFLGFAFLSRQMSVYTSLFIIVVLFLNPNFISRRSKAINIIGFLVVMGGLIGCYLYFNAIRFSSPFDSGYSYIISTQHTGSSYSKHGLFSPFYIPFNFVYMFLQGPHFIFDDMAMPRGMDPFGTSITFASPFVFFSFYAKGNRLLIRTAWLTIVLCLVHILLYYKNGWTQENAQRFTMDFMPVLMVLVAMSAKYVNRRVLYMTIAYSVILNAIAFVIIPILKDLERLF